MAYPFRLLFLAALAWLGYVLISEASRVGAMESPDQAKVIMLFGGVVVDGVIMAVIVATTVVPAIGRWVGGYFYSSGREYGYNPHREALSKLAQGDAYGAIDEYERVIAKNPGDSLAVSEIARICCRDLDDTARAAAVLERALKREWTQDQGAFLAGRLADIYLMQGDSRRAMELLQQVIRSMKGTRYAANAQHRMNEITRELQAGR